MSTTIKRANHASCPVLIKNRIEFTCTNMSGRKVNQPGGHVAPQWLTHPSAYDDMVRFNEDKGEITYVVRSFDTPIAWYSEARGWYIVKAKFTVTTSKHQGRLYMVPTGPVGV